MKILFESLKTPKDVSYTETNEWVRVDGDEIVIGITDYAQAAMRGMMDDEHLQNIFVLGSLEVGDQVSAKQIIGECHSSKTCEDISVPVSGIITAINGELELNDYVISKNDVAQDPYGDGWLVRIRPDDINDVKKLLTADVYESMSAEEYKSQFGG